MESRKELLIIASTTCVLLLFCGIIIYKQINHSTETSLNPTSDSSQTTDSLNKMEKLVVPSLSKREWEGNEPKHEKSTSYSLNSSEWNTVVTQLRKSNNPQEKIDLINSLAAFDSIALTKLILGLLKDKNKEVRLSAIRLLNGKEQGDILKCIEYALDDPEKGVREIAVVLIADTNNKPQSYTPLLIKGIGDSTRDIRLAIFDVLGNKPVSVQVEVFKAGMISSYRDVKENTVEMLMTTPSIDTVEILFQGLDDGDEKFRNLVNTKIDLLFAREFKNSSDAAQWWMKNKNQYSKDLFKKNQDPINPPPP